MDLRGAVDQVAAELTGLELDGRPVRVVRELGKVRPPCLWVALREIDHAAAGVGEVVVNVFAVAPQADEYVALDVLGELLELVTGVLSPTAVTEMVDLSPTSSQTGLPALKFTTTVLVN